MQCRIPALSALLQDGLHVPRQQGFEGVYGRRQDGTASDLHFDGNRGTGPTAIPYYLLIVASPVEIPWRVQYRMQTDAFVGRLVGAIRGSPAR